MRSKIILISGVAISIFAMTAAALASHGKVGLWNVTISMGGSHMPDLSKLPPEVQAKMKAMGMTANGSGMTVQHCMTAKEVALDTIPSDQHDKNCALSNSKMDGHAMSADIVCKGDFNGTGHMLFTFDSDTHYTGDVSMTGTSQGHPVNHDQKFEGRWISADCGSVTH